MRRRSGPAAAFPAAGGGAEGPEAGSVRLMVAWGLGRALAITTAVVVLYYLLPLDLVANAISWTIVAVAALVILAAASTWQVRAILTSPHPGIRGIEGIAAIAPLFLLLFAATYFVMARANPSHFSSTDLTRTDTLYLTVTTFSTVGFGDITATSQSSRAVMIVQMVLDLIVLGLGVRVFVGAVRLGRERVAATTPPTHRQPADHTTDQPAREPR